MPLSRERLRAIYINGKRSLIVQGDRILGEVVINEAQPDRSSICVIVKRTGDQCWATGTFWGDQLSRAPEFVEQFLGVAE